MRTNRMSRGGAVLLGCTVMGLLLLLASLLSACNGEEIIISGPKITIPTPVPPDTEIPITIDISGPDAKTEITWSHDCEGGKIVSGDGSPSITYRTPSQPGLCHVWVEVRAGRRVERKSLALLMGNQIGLTIENPHEGKLVDHLESAKGYYDNMPIGWHLIGVTRNKGGGYYLSNPVDVPAGDGEWTLNAYFGDRTYGIGSEYQYFVIAVEADGEVERELVKRDRGSRDPLPQEGPYLYMSQPITVERAGPLNHWYASYWADKEMESGEAQFREEIESQFIFKNWGGDAPAEGLPANGWSARFVRRVHFPQAGPYRFYAERDDGARVWVDGAFVIDAWNSSYLVRESQTVTLTQGYHEIEVAFFDDQQTAHLGFWYEGPEPPPDPPPISTSYWRVDYYPNQELEDEPVWYERRQSDALDIQWGNDKGTPIGGQGATEMVGDYFSTRSTRLVFFQEGLYQFEAKGDDGIRFKVDDEVILEESGAWQNCNPCRRQVNLTEGQHTLVVEHWDGKLDAHVSLKWAQVSPVWESLSNPYVVRAMAVDDEYVWTGGGGGLVRWKKSTLTPKVFRSESGLPDNMVNALLVDRDGTLWVGTGEGYNQGGSGLGHYDGESWQTLTKADGLCEDTVLGLFQDRDGSLWVSTDGSLGHYDLASSEWRCYDADDGLGSNYPIAVHCDSQGKLWVSVGGAGVSVLQIDNTWKTYTREEIDTDCWGLEPIAEDGEGNIWFGSWEGAFRYDGQSWRQFTKEDGLPTSNTFALVRDGAGNMWFGTSEGVARYDGQNWQVFTTADGLASNYVTGLVMDQDGILWAGHTGDVGLSRFDERQWIASPVPEGTLVPNRITSIHQDQAGKLWFGTGFPPTGSGDGVYIFDGTTWEIFDEPDCLEDNFIDTVFQDKKGNFWFGYGIANCGDEETGCGLTRFDGECKTFTMSDSDLGGDRVEDIIQDDEGNLWFGTSDGGVSRYDGQDWQVFSGSDLPSNDVNALYQDSDGNLWFGTQEKGAVRYDGETWEVFTTTHGLPSNWVTDIIEDDHSRLWVGTGDGGIGVYDLADGTWSAYQLAEDGLLSNKVYAMRVDKSGWVWVGTPEGVSCFTGRRWLSFTPADGLASRHVRTIWEDDQGNLWFGTGGGISRLQFVPMDRRE